MNIISLTKPFCKGPKDAFIPRWPSPQREQVKVKSFDPLSYLTWLLAFLGLIFDGELVMLANGL